VSVLELVLVLVPEQGLVLVPGPGSQ